MFSFYASEWRSLLHGFDAETSAVLARIAQTKHQTLAEHFYSAMLEDEAASGLLSHEQVHSRLLGSMQRWIVQVLGTPEEEDLEALVAQDWRGACTHRCACALGVAWRSQP